MTSPFGGAPIKLTRWNKQDAGTTGIWGDVTASLDWCEANYPSDKIPLCEPVNTLTNLSFIWLAYFGWQKAKANRLYDDCAYIWVGMAIGIGSFLFHGTLRYEAQLLDELPMVYASSVMVYTALTAGSNPRGLWQTLVLYDALVTIIYLVWPNPVFHQVSYGLTVACQVFRMGYLLIYSGRLEKTPEQSRVNRQIRKLSIQGLAMYLLGFAIWNCDNLLCSQITAIKDDIGFPYRVLLEGHGYWHILTGAGAHWGACAVTMLKHCLNEGHEDFELKWSYGLVPWVHRKSSRKGKKRIE